ncbi:MAG TPA: ribonuclease HII [Candidatus Gallacutalibacter stercoravium]|nr:ribonuclease HII [Candidatus Gallacutalibacter stercoravium]
MDWLCYENEAMAAGLSPVCGVDEAGRGPLAGPVFAAAVILPPGLLLPGVNDSKKLSPKKREALFDLICQNAVSYGIASASEAEIDSVNILNATFLAMQRAVAQLDPQPALALVDGNRLPSLPMPAKAIVKGDALSLSIAAASILAKVSRDRLMEELGRQYPQYQFDKHKGYGTKLHIELIRQYGPCPLHRRSFLTKILGEKN